MGAASPRRYRVAGKADRTRPVRRRRPTRYLADRPRAAEDVRRPAKLAAARPAARFRFASDGPSAPQGRDDARAGAISRMDRVAPRGDGPRRQTVALTQRHLRVSFAQVQGYEPRDGVWDDTRPPSPASTPSTRRGALSGPADHASPAPSAPASRGRTVASTTCRSFPAEATPGGNSGRPVLDGRALRASTSTAVGEVANDFGYNPAVARNMVDVRYLLWVLRSARRQGGALLASGRPAVGG